MVNKSRRAARKNVSANTRLRRKGPSNGTTKIAAVDVSQYQHIAGHLNPFEPKGAKRFGIDSTPSIPMHLRSTIPCTSDVNGYVHVQVEPRMKELWRTALDPILSTWNAWNDHPTLTNLSAVGGEYRVVSFGIHVFTVLAPLSASGSYSIGTRNAEDDTDPVLNYEYVERVAGRANDMDIYWIGKAGDMPDNYIALTDPPSGRDQSFQAVTVSMSGVPASTAACQIDVYLNIEWKPPAFTLYATIATPANAYHPGLVQTVATAHRESKNAHSSLDEWMAFLKKWGPTALTMAAPYMGEVKTAKMITDIGGNVANRAVNGLLGDNLGPMVARLM